MSTPTPPADDVREALVSELRQWAAMIGTEPRGARGLFTRAADALAEVGPRGSVTDAEVDAAGRVMYALWDEWDEADEMAASLRSLVRTALEAAREARS